jgi:selenide,water dikinase
MVRLTQYSHGAGCGCKISPQVLSQMLHSNEAAPDNALLMVGNNTRDDAAVYDLGDGSALISTTDFFMPIVDDPYEFGRIASANAISDVFAMGGRPILAIAILGWPVDKLPPEVAQRVIEGSRSICAEAGIPLAGGHSIDSPEPIFGLAVNGLVPVKDIKTNSGAQAGDLLFLTKPIGIGIYTTAIKKGILAEEHIGLAEKWMTTLNAIGAKLAKIPGVHALTDVTGFGLMGHLTEMCEGSGLQAEVYSDRIPLLPGLKSYIEQKSVPGGTNRNFASYGSALAPMSDMQKAIVCDPQTSGGLLIAVSPDAQKTIEDLFNTHGLTNFTQPVGMLKNLKDEFLITLI